MSPKILNITAPAFNIQGKTLIKCGMYLSYKWVAAIRNPDALAKHKLWAGHALVICRCVV